MKNVHAMTAEVVAVMTGVVVVAAMIADREETTVVHAGMTADQEETTTIASVHNAMKVAIMHLLLLMLQVEI